MCSSGALRLSGVLKPLKAVGSFFGLYLQVSAASDPGYTDTTADIHRDAWTLLKIQSIHIIGPIITDREKKNLK